MNMGEKILKLRKARGWSQEELAEQLGVTRQAVSRWEADSAKPDADRIIALCNTFGVSSDYLLCVDGETDAPVAAPPAKSAEKRVPDRMIIGIVFVALSAVAFFALTIAGAIQPYTYDGYGGAVGYVLGNDLIWFAVCILLMFLTGTAMLLWKYLRKAWTWITGRFKK